jgi:hypothetical protein
VAQLDNALAKAKEIFLQQIWNSLNKQASILRNYTTVT